MKAEQEMVGKSKVIIYRTHLMVSATMAKKYSAVVVVIEMRFNTSFSARSFEKIASRILSFLIDFLSQPQQVKVLHAQIVLKLKSCPIHP